MARNTSHKGFTLLELTIVLLLIAIGSALVVSRYQKSQARLYSDVNILKSHLRYAQLFSLGSSDIWYIDFIDNRNYRLYKKEPNGSITPQLFPALDEFTVSLHTGHRLDIDGSDPSHTLIAYDALGIPSYLNNDTVTPMEDRTFAIRDNGFSIFLTLKALTGFIP